MKCEPSVFSTTKRRPVCICCSADGSHYPQRTYAPGLFVLHQLLDCIMGYVYFIEAIGQNLFKIGITNKLNVRIDRLATACPFPLRIYGVIRTSEYVELEKKLHREYSAKRMKSYSGSFNEWFRLTRDGASQAIAFHGGIICAYQDESQVSVDPTQTQYRHKYNPLKDRFTLYHGLLFFIMALPIYFSMYVKVDELVAQVSAISGAPSGLLCAGRMYYQLFFANNKKDLFLNHD